MASLLEVLSARARPLAYLVALLAVLAASAVIVMSGDVVRSNDEVAFMAIAGNIVSEGMFAETPGQPTAYRAPGPVFLVTPVVALGGGLVEARLFNAVIFGLGLVALFHLVRRHASPLAALFAVCMVPLWPVALFAATTLYPQTLAATLLVLTIWMVDRLRDGPSLGRAVVAGLACGALVLTTPVVLLLFPLLLIWLIHVSPRWLPHAVIFCAVSGGLVSSWTVRNYFAFDAFVPVATSSGYNLLAGNAPNARYNTSLNVRFPEYVYAEITGKTEVERNDIMTEAAFREIANDPGRFVRLYAAKFAHWFHFSNRLLSDEVLEDGAAPVPVGAREVILFVTYALVIMGPLLIRLALLRRHPFRRIELLFLAFWIGAGLVYALFFTRVRFRLPFDWLIIASNAMFLAAIAENWLARARDRLRPGT